MIIAIKEKDKVVVGYSNVDYWLTISDKDTVDEENIAIKVSPTGKLFVMGALNRTSDLFLYDDEFLSMEISPQNIIRKVIPYIKDKLREKGKNKENEWDNALIICDNESIYALNCAFEFYEVDDYCCYGFKKETLQSVLDENKGLPAEQRILETINFMTKQYKKDFFPLTIIDTKTKEFKHFYKGENIRWAF